MQNETTTTPVIETVVPDVVIAPTVEVDPIAEANARATKAEHERDNYKKVALKRLGKLPNDAEFLSGTEDTSELSVQEQIKLALLDEEVKRALESKETAYQKVVRERDEALLALKNRPNTPIGGDSTTTVAVKDNVLSDSQIETLTAQATRLKVDPAKFIESFKTNLQKKG